MIRQAGDGGLDLLAVQRDDELLVLLGARRPVAAGDEAARLLASLAAEVDLELPATVPPVPPAAGSATAVGTDVAHHHRVGVAGVAAAVLLGGAVSLGGAAAAVTGDPLAPYKTVGHAVQDVGSAVGDALSLGDDDLPEQAAPVAHLNKRLAGARAALAHGDTAAVQALVDDLTAVLGTADLSDEQRAALQRRLDQLEDSLAGATPAPGARTGPVGSGKGPAADPGPDGKAPAGDDEQQDQEPADKEPAGKGPAGKGADEGATDEKAPKAGTGGPATRSDTTEEGPGDTGATSGGEVVDEPTPTPQPQASTADEGSQQSTELESDATGQEGRGSSRR